jgi:hypothetical protein
MIPESIFWFDLYGKFEQTRIVDCDLTDGDLCPELQPDVYMDQVAFETVKVTNIWKP